MEEKLAVSYLVCYFLERLSFALSLVFKDANAPDVGLSGSVEAVGSNHIALRIALVHRRDLDSHTTVDVLDGINCVLAVEGSNQHA